MNEWTKKQMKHDTALLVVQWRQLICSTHKNLGRINMIENFDTHEHHLHWAINMKYFHQWKLLWFNELAYSLKDNHVGILWKLKYNPILKKYFTNFSKKERVTFSSNLEKKTSKKFWTILCRKFYPKIPLITHYFIETSPLNIFYLFAMFCFFSISFMKKEEKKDEMCCASSNK